MKKLDIHPGDEFGNWTVLKRVDSNSGWTQYLCRCKCGEEKVVRGHHLISGKSQSCGKCGARSIERVVDAKPKTNNTSGQNGVSWKEKDKRWEASISYHGKRMYLGYFEDLDDAITARKAAERYLAVNKGLPDD
ncbi:hypothetical protein [Faecalibaculum rodentium]|uniref:AP2/ERF domain-containing protein n=1 Tax=Faecalibaculum rodentium TaxID=1702221 RepID=A0A140DSX6_9FIRM|nr:hypothetical protein [Faecalibaculum rodentium]AMK53753.1 hypothetical protein AALO17_06190 [Faecalibaculum rodentium]OLU44523.1 hypothetical protein BO223_08025 [Faecalibaculum rodentium]